MTGSHSNNAAWSAEKRDPFLATVLALWDAQHKNWRHDVWWLIRFYILLIEKRRKKLYADADCNVADLVDPWCHPVRGSFWKHHPKIASKGSSRDNFYAAAIDHTQHLRDSRALFRVDRSSLGGLGIFAQPGVTAKDLAAASTALYGFETSIPKRLLETVKRHDFPSAICSHKEREDHITRQHVAIAIFYLLAGPLSLANHCCRGAARGKKSHAKLKQSDGSFCTITRDRALCPVLRLREQKAGAMTELVGAEESSIFLWTDNEVFIDYGGSYFADRPCRCPWCRTGATPLPPTGTAAGIKRKRHNISNQRTAADVPQAKKNNSPSNSREQQQAEREQQQAERQKRAQDRSARSQREWPRIKRGKL